MKEDCWAASDYFVGIRQIVVASLPSDRRADQVGKNLESVDLRICPQPIDATIIDGELPPQIAVDLDRRLEIRDDPMCIEYRLYDAKFRACNVGFDEIEIYTGFGYGWRKPL